MDENILHQMVKRLRISRDAEAPDVLEFWRQHGIEWARDEASFTEIKRLIDISKTAAGQHAEEAVSYVVGELKAIWRAGWTGSVEPYGWDEMNDMLTPKAYLAFLQGVESAWNEVSNRL